MAQDKRDWRKLCLAVANEADPRKLLEFTEALFAGA
jgi:hypothetical protein